ncbi:MAG: hypothetical protein ABIE22_04075 [archaeon]
MTCANILLVIAAVVTFVFAVWDVASPATTQWVLAITAIVVLLVALFGVKCKWCEGMKAKQAAKPIKKKKR